MSRGNKRRKRMRELGLMPPLEPCVAHKKTGERCKKYPMVGQVVCEKHGGKAPQNIAKAKERIAMLADAAAQRMDKLSQDARSEQVRFLATKDLLDRAKVGTEQELVVSVRPWEDNIEGVFYEDDSDIVDAELVEEAPRAIPPSDWEYQAEVLTEKDSEPKYRRGKHQRAR